MKKITQVKSDYSNGLITKLQFIKQMHEIHEALFEYAELIKTTDIKKIEVTDDSVVMTSRESEIKMICDKDDQRIAPIEILNFGHYEGTDFNLVLKLIKNGFSVFDVGANFGWYSLNLSRRYPDCKFYSFEPIPKTFKYLESNVKLNDFKNINIYNFGLSNEEKNTNFYYYSSGSGNASLANLSDDDKVEEANCVIKRMDDFIAETKVALDFIKCDVEGAELLVFRGGIKSIEKFKPIIFTEILRKWSQKFNYRPNEIIELLASIGYNCFVASNEKLVKIESINDDTKETNFFFLHTDKHQDQITQLS